jgi:hypothetical protein
MNKIKVLLGATALTFSAITNAALVDLTGWTAEGGASSWDVQSGNATVLQSVNGDPTVFFDSTSTGTQGTALNGSIKVQTASDDDYIGFVLGYNSGEITSNSTDFFLVDWKQGTQFHNGSTSYAGLSISHVTDASNPWNDLWSHVGGVNEIKRAATLGSTGWADNTEYDFNIVFQNNLIEVSVNNVLELSISSADVAGLSSFSDGAFGFYNMSQAQVLYSAVEQTNCQTDPSAPQCQTSDVPEPSIIALFGLGLVGIGFARRRQS